MLKRLDSETVRIPGLAFLEGLEKLACVSCLGFPPPRRSGWLQWPWAVGPVATLAWMPDLPNFYLVNKLNVLLLMFGINTRLDSFKTWCLLPTKAGNFICAMSCVEEDQVSPVCCQWVLLLFRLPCKLIKHGWGFGANDNAAVFHL